MKPRVLAKLIYSDVAQSTSKLCITIIVPSYIERCEN